jgi:N-acetyl-beta-hexosaminidase
MRSKFVVPAVLGVIFSMLTWQPAVYGVTLNDIIPKPSKVDPGSGHFNLEEGGTSIYLDQNAPASALQGGAKVVEYFQIWMKEKHGLIINKSASSGNNQIQLLYFRTPGHYWDIGVEGYTLDVTQNEIIIYAVSAEGWFYGIQSLLQLMPLNLKNQDLKIPAGSVEDTPRFGWRGMHLDVSRHFMPVDFILKFLDILAMHKMNTFHWHLTDDQGWRLQIEGYPRLTDIGSRRVNREHLYYESPERKDPPPQSGEMYTRRQYYSKADVDKIVEYAANRFITVIPEIEMPGHASAALAALNDLRCDFKEYFVKPAGVWPPINVINVCKGYRGATNANPYTILGNIYGRVKALFPNSEYVHTGGDEASTNKWILCPDCYDELGSVSAEDLQSVFSSRLQKILQDKERTMVGWDEILEGDPTGLAEPLSTDAVIMAWRIQPEYDDDGVVVRDPVDHHIKYTFEQAKLAAEEGYNVVMTPYPNTYFDYRQGEALDYWDGPYKVKHAEPVAVLDPDHEKWIELEKAYKWDPIPEGLATDKQQHILGAQGQLWTEYMHNGNHVEYMALPRMTALAEVAWSQEVNRKDGDGKYDITNFKDRLKDNWYLRLDQLGINYRDHEENFYTRPVTGPAARPMPRTYYDATGLTLGEVNPSGYGSSDYVPTEPGRWHEAENFYGYWHIDGTVTETDECTHSSDELVVGRDAVAEYLMRFDNERSMLVLRGKAADGMAGPVEMKIYIDGDYKTSAFFYNNNCLQDVRVVLPWVPDWPAGQSPYGENVHAVAVQFGNGTPADERSMYLDKLKMERAPVEPAEYLRAHWKMENNYYDAVGTHNGTLHGGAGFSNDSKVGRYSLSFPDGNGDYMSSGLVTDATDDFIATMWVKWGGTTGQYQSLISNGTSGTNGFTLFLYPNSNMLGIEIAGVVMLNSYAGLAKDTWQHVAVKRESAASGGRWSVLLNGENLPLYGGGIPGAIYATPNTPAGSTYVGGLANHIDRCFKGKIDDVRIYERALSMDEISAIIKQGDLKAHWKMESNPYDATGFYDGTLSGDAYFSADSKVGSYSLKLGGNGAYMSSGLVTNAPDNVTMTMWVKWDGPTGKYQSLISNGTSGPSGSGFTLFLYNSDQLAVDMATVETFSSNKALTVGKWQHVAAKRGSGKWKIFLDGIPIYEKTTSAPKTPSGSTYVGTHSDRDKFFNGRIDDVRIYERALSDTEIRELAKP